VGLLCPDLQQRRMLQDPKKGTQCILMHVNDRSSKMMGAGLVVPKSAAETDAAGSQYTY